MLDVPADNDGIAGAQLAIDDNNTTGRFINQHYSLIDEAFRSDGEVAAASSTSSPTQGASWWSSTSTPRACSRRRRQPRRGASTIFNVGATDDWLRERDCRANVIHVAPTRSMLADAWRNI